MELYYLKLIQLDVAVVIQQFLLYIFYHPPNSYLPFPSFIILISNKHPSYPFAIYTVSIVFFLSYPLYTTFVYRTILYILFIYLRLPSIFYILYVFSRRMAVVFFLLSLSPIFIILYTYYFYYNTCPRCSSRQTSSRLFIFLCSISSITNACLPFIIFLTLKYLVLLFWVYIIFQSLSHGLFFFIQPPLLGFL